VARDAALEQRQLTEQELEQRRLAASVRPEDRQALARAQIEGHAAKDRLRSIAGRRPVDGEERHPASGLQPAAPPLKPRTIPSAFAASIELWAAPADPFGPSVSPYRV